MNLLAEAFAWIFSPDRLTGSSPLPAAIGLHLYYTFISVLIASLIAVPLGFYIGHTGKGRNAAIAISGAARAVPSFGLILLLVLVMGVTQKPLAATVAFVLLGIPSILAGAYAGLEAIDRRTIDAARAVGMTEWQILLQVEVPLGLPLLIGGIRAGALQIVATVVLAAYVTLGGLGTYIIQGIPLSRYDMILGSAIVIVALALALDGLFALLQRFVVPRGVTAGLTQDIRTTSSRRRAVVGSSLQEGKG
ncbi:ABC transporter permease [Salinibacterium sp. G-O1]|uniref:ABC transporter permease n=1 Tax=Salinibacterium sp. G-O1 TaxID=3046208 RepID=UPI0024BB6127|nr:ABC transporter permease [Salinibacterium sp. G-O1]MDJ0335449.1 ABC transporter permease [Salinibacterium sp. G-O1]